MFDFKLTPKGDILLVGSDIVSSFKLSFGITRYKTQQISFSTSATEMKKPKHQQSISFYFQEQPKRTMTDLHIEGDKEKLQAARIQLKTELKNTYNYDVGSLFYQHNHTIFKDKESLEPMGTLIQDIMEQYFPGCKVTLSFESHEGFFWCQTIFANIYDSDNTFIDKIEI